ncbi:MAG: hypothetical protein ACP5R2_14280 [Anaerolineae bacterium]
MPTLRRADRTAKVFMELGSSPQSYLIVGGIPEHPRKPPCPPTEYVVAHLAGPQYQVVVVRGWHYNLRFATLIMKSAKVADTLQGL